MRKKPNGGLLSVRSKAMLVFESSAMEKPAYFVLVDWRDDQIAAIRDVLFAPYALESVGWVQLASCSARSALPQENPPRCTRRVMREPITNDAHGDDGDVRGSDEAASGGAANDDGDTGGSAAVPNIDRDDRCAGWGRSGPSD